MKRPDLDAALAPLKGFQRNTVDHAFHRLFEAEDSTHRFLVADEVGLGKTLVARGIIARTIEHLWETVERIDIVYICSNASIARQNLRKLELKGGGERSFALATRLTMLATQLAPKDGESSLAKSKLNFVSFTPQTSFQMGHSGGRREERRVLYHLLEPLIGRSTALANLLQGGVRDAEAWRNELRWHTPLEATIQKGFNTRFTGDATLRSDVDQVLDEWFQRRRTVLPLEARIARNNVVSRLRQLLASECMQGLEADLVILDEFQRFKGLLETQQGDGDPAAELAQALFGASTPEGEPVRTLLLSATPYKLYTADAEIEHEDHFKDFLGTTRFLMGGDEARVDDLKTKLGGFATALKRAASGGEADVTSARDAVQAVLRKVMARTERVSSTEDLDAMVHEPPMGVTVESADVRQYMAADALYKAVGAGDPLMFWKSAPYLAHFTRSYRFNDMLDDALLHDPLPVADVLRKHGAAFLQAEAVHKFEAMDAGNGKLRELVGGVVNTGMWKMLWMPPTVPYWPLEGAFEGQERQTKSLLFSAWNVVPQVVSAVVSYETERLMSGGRFNEYYELGKQQRGLLRFAQLADGRRSSHRILLLLLPCLALADECHPLSAPAGTDRRSWVRTQVGCLLETLPNPTSGDVDTRWEWALPLLLDPGLRDFLEAWKKDSSRDRPNPEHFNAYLDDLLTLDPQELGVRPPDLLDHAVEIALGAPGVLASRTLGAAGVSDETRRHLAVDVAMGFWSLFNQPTTTTLLRDLFEERTPYWRAVLRYSGDGNLQAVLDETWHLMWEQHSWSDEPGEDGAAAKAAAATIQQMVKAIRPVDSRVHARFLSTGDDKPVTETEVRMRTDIALRFGAAKGEAGELTQDDVRIAFNSPFRPFILASTSVGQEGLDFHPWCHRLVHWDLPGNPVDMEQREGRVHRYKGHAVRRNVASRHAEDGLHKWRRGADVWQLIFDAANDAARARGERELIPYWIAPGEHRVERRVPMLPWTREQEAFTRLKKQLAAYRVVFGQPRQEELLRLLDRAEVDVETLRGWVIDLRP